MDNKTAGAELTFAKVVSDVSQPAGGLAAAAADIAGLAAHDTSSQ